MKYDSLAILLALGTASADPLVRSIKVREVPQEHSHNVFLDLVRTSLATNNPQGIKDPVFGLLGNAAAAGGAGSVTDLDCLQQATADQAFTNAKAAGDVGGMAAALIYRALERNTQSVGGASALCTETATNPEIAAITQHQDPASANATTVNKGVVLALAKELAGIGADSLLALESGTFAPGKIGDPTAAGNSCDTENDEPGCIFSQNLLVLDATEAEISAAVADVAQTFTGTGAISQTDINLTGLPVAEATGAVTGSGDSPQAAATPDAAATTTAPTAAANAAAEATSSCSVITTTVGAGTAVATLSAAAATTPGTPVAAGNNVQTFTGTLGGAPPPVISSAGDRPFSVNGNTFVNAGAAVQRSCAIQHNACADAANSGELAGGVSKCDAQESACNAASSATKKTKRALDFGTCGNPTILFEAGLDGRNTEAFIAADQTSFNHGSALNIAVIAGFICQRLGSPCNAPADVQASCTSASAAAVATTQDQAAADVFNSILGIGGDAAAVTSAPDATTTPAPANAAGANAAGANVITITTCA